MCTHPAPCCSSTRSANNRARCGKRLCDQGRTVETGVSRPETEDRTRAHGRGERLSLRCLLTEGFHPRGQRLPSRPSQAARRKPHAAHCHRDPSDPAHQLLSPSGADSNNARHASVHMVHVAVFPHLPPGSGTVCRARREKKKLLGVLTAIVAIPPVLTASSARTVETGP